MEEYFNEFNPFPEDEAPKTPFVPEKEQYTVVDVRFRDGGKCYFFDPGELKLKAGQNVVIDTARGPEFGTCTAGNHVIPASEVVAALRNVIRVATERDCRIAAENREKEKKAYAICQEKIRELGLDMQLVSAEWSFDGSKLLFFFTADGRVDFRELVKNLAAAFRTRIELRQIGVRDKAKMVGGLGMCGRPFCCREFLPDFQPVSIKMAKTQSLSLNPTKISGTCGRLMCCLKYEQDAYEDLIRSAPKADSFVDTADGRGTITEVCLLKQSVKVRMEKDPDTIGCYRNEDIVVLRSGKQKKNDAPIPEDLAPLSSQRSARKPLPADELPELVPVKLKSESINTPVRPFTEEEEERKDPGEALPGEETQGEHRGKRKRHRGRRGGKSAVAEAVEQVELAAERTAEKAAERQIEQQHILEAEARQNARSLPEGEEAAEHPEGGEGAHRSRRRRHRGGHGKGSGSSEQTQEARSEQPQSEQRTARAAAPAPAPAEGSGEKKHSGNRRHHRRKPKTEA